jgi:hypothetical protein
MNIPIDNSNYQIIPIFQLTKSKISYPLSLDIVKRHLRLDNDFMDDDDYIQDLIYAATQYAENYLGKDIAKTENTLRIDDFDDDSLQVMEGNFISIISVKNAGGVSIGTIHQTSVHYNYFTIEWTGNVASDPIEIKFYTGHEDGTYPEIIKQAILIAVADFYDNSRTSLIFSGLTDSKIFERCLESYKSIRF